MSGGDVVPHTVQEGHGDATILKLRVVVTCAQQAAPFYVTWKEGHALVKGFLTLADRERF